MASTTQLHDLPDAVLRELFTLVTDTRSRNAMAFVCRKWRSLERSTRTHLTIRGNVRDLYLLPNCFSAITTLDLSFLSPWGHPFLHNDHNHLLAERLRLSFPSIKNLTVYARNPSTLRALAPRWPCLTEAKLVRWHQRANHPPGSDISPILSSCPKLKSLDLSSFYFWTEDILPALQANPLASALITKLNLLGAAAAEGFRGQELHDIAAACPNLKEFFAPCVFNPRYLDFVGDEALLALAGHCPKLSLLHLADPATYSPSSAPPFTVPGVDGYAPEDSRITPVALGQVFAALPMLEDVAIELCHNVRDSGTAFEALGNSCPKLKSLKLCCFHGVCVAAGLHLDGVAVCGGLKSLSVKNSADLSDASLLTMARGCRQLSQFDIQGCRMITESGLKRMAGMLRSTLVDVRISGCDLFDAAGSLRALEPIRDQIQKLHIDCIWVRPRIKQLPQDDTENGIAHDSHLNQLEQEDELEENGECENGSTSKRRRYSEEADWVVDSNGDTCFWLKSWQRLRHLSLWLPAGEVLTPLAYAGLVDCPELEEITIKVEGDCRACSKPVEKVFGLSTLLDFSKLSKMKLDLGEAIGYALTAPMGQMDLSLWERFYLHGIGELSLHELDYWPPQDKDVNQRTLSLPATGLIQGCETLRKLFIHGTANEHFMRFFLKMPNLRDVQLREDYYPAPEYDMSTEMRVESCSRFEDALNGRQIPH